jgi:hypothetical protein
MFCYSTLVVDYFSFTHNLITLKFKFHLVYKDQSRYQVNHVKCLTDFFKTRGISASPSSCRRFAGNSMLLIWIVGILNTAECHGTWIFPTQFRQPAQMHASEIACITPTKHVPRPKTATSGPHQPIARLVRKLKRSPTCYFTTNEEQNSKR